jgi:hypothetical protein
MLEIVSDFTFLDDARTPAMSQLTTAFLLFLALVAVSLLSERDRPARYCVHRWHRTTEFGEMGYCPADEGRTLFGKAIGP